MTKRPTNIAASVGQRLRNIARERNEDFALVLTKFALERLLFRLSQSKHKDVFVLKGALLFELWTQERYRSTRDADLLARGDNTPERFVSIFRDVCNIDVVDDGLRFDAETVKAERITEDANYQGVRVTFMGYLENARIPIQIDIGFGDVVTPAPAEAKFPTLLDFPAAKLLAYPRESVIAEKFEAMVKLGIANSRMKDFYDLWKLSRDFSFDGPLLSEAVRKRSTGVKPSCHAINRRWCSRKSFIRMKLKLSNGMAFARKTAGISVTFGLKRSAWRLGRSLCQLSKRSKGAQC